MNKKKVIGILIIFFFLAVPAYAKQKEQPQEQQLTADQIVAKLELQLGLSAAQVDEVKSIVENHLAQEKQLRLEEKKQLSKVLTDQQLYTWNFLQNEGGPKPKKKQSLF